MVLPGAHRAHDAERRCRPGTRSVDVAQRRLARRIAGVAEGEVAELDLAAQLAQRHARRAGRAIVGTSESTSSMRCIDAAPRCTSATTQPMMKVGKVSS